MILDSFHPYSIWQGATYLRFMLTHFTWDYKCALRWNISLVCFLWSDLLVHILSLLPLVLCISYGTSQWATIRKKFLYVISDILPKNRRDLLHDIFYLTHQLKEHQDYTRFRTNRIKGWEYHPVGFTRHTLSLLFASLQILIRRLRNRQIQESSFIFCFPNVWCQSFWPASLRFLVGQYWVFFWLLISQCAKQIANEFPYYLRQ